MQTKISIAVIWGWAAWMMAAAHLAKSEHDFDIHIFEKNSRLWAKVIISWGGRCNLTTWNYKKKDLLACYPRWADFLGKQAFKMFWPKKIYRWFEDHGIPLKIEADNRVFPKSDDGIDVVEVFEKIFHKKKVNTHYKEWVDEINMRIWPEACQDWCPREKNYLVVTNKTMYQFDFVIVATGWSTYAHTWSTGDWYAFARKCWHKIAPLGPSLNSFMTRESWPKSVSWLSLPGATLRAVLMTGEKSGESISVTGPILFTHFWLSGPATFALSSHLPYEEISEKSQFRIAIQLFSDKDVSYRDKALISLINLSPKKEIRNVIAGLMPKRLAEQLILLAKIRLDDKAAHVTKDQRKVLAGLMWGNLELNLAQRRPGDEFVTAWGVELDQVDPTSMQSRICPWMFFVGEVLNIDWFTWGYNLSSSWATGYVAADGIIDAMTTLKA